MEKGEMKIRLLMFDKIIFWNVRDLNDVKKRNVIRGCLNRYPAFSCLPSRIQVVSS